MQFVILWCRRDFTTLLWPTTCLQKQVDKLREFLSTWKRSSQSETVFINFDSAFTCRVIRECGDKTSSSRYRLENSTKLIKRRDKTKNKHGMKKNCTIKCRFRFRSLHFLSRPAQGSAPHFFKSLHIPSVMLTNVLGFLVSSPGEKCEDSLHFIPFFQA